MASALKCDRCGKLYEGYSGIKVEDKGNRYYVMSLENLMVKRSYDMCPECMTQLVEFIKAGKEAENDK